MFKKNFWSSTFIYAVGFLFLRSISFLLLPLYTNILTPHDLGVVFIFIVFLAFMNALYSFGMDSSLLKYYNTHQDSFSTSLIGVLVFAIPFSLLIYVNAQHLSVFLFNNTTDNASWLFKNNLWVVFAIIILCLDAISSRIVVLIRILNLPWYYLSITFINIVSSLGFNLYFLHYKSPGLKFDGVVLAMLFVSILQFFCLIPLAIKTIKNYTFNYTIFKQMCRFAWPFFPATIFFIIIELSDRIMIEYFLTLEDVGLYGAGYKVGALMLMVVRGFNLNWQPYYLKYEKKLNNQALLGFAYIGNIVLLFFIVVATLISAFWPALISIKIGTIQLIGGDFFAGGKIIPYVLISYVFYGLFILQMPSIYLQNKQNWAPVFWGAGAMINIIGNLILIPCFGFLGAAIATLFSYAGMALFLMFKNYSWLWIKYDFKLLFLSVFIGFVFYFLWKSPLLFNVIIFRALIFLFYIIIMSVLFYRAKSRPGVL